MMRITLKNSVGCDLDAWDSIDAMVADIQRGDVVFCDGDRLEFEEEAD